MYAHLCMRAGLAESARPAPLPLPAAQPVREGLSDIDCFCVSLQTDTCRCGCMAPDAGFTGNRDAAESKNSVKDPGPRRWRAVASVPATVALVLGKVMGAD